MTGEEKYNEFLKKIADYSASHGLDLVPYNDGIDQIVNVSRFELTKFTSEELIEYSLSVNLHVEYLQTCYNKEQAVLDWASAAIWYIISPQMSQFGGQYSKWEEKYNLAVRGNDLANDILKVKNIAQTNVTLFRGKIDNYKKISDNFTQLARRKNV